MDQLDQNLNAAAWLGAFDILLPTLALGGFGEAAFAILLGMFLTDMLIEAFSEA